MGHEEIIGMQQDIIGNHPYGAFARNRQYPQIGQGGGMGPSGMVGPGGGLGMGPGAGHMLGAAGFPGFAQRSGDFSYGYGWPGSDPAAMEMVQNAYGPCAFPPWPSCFGPPPNPLLVQKTLQPARWVEPRCPTDIRTELVGLGEECIGPCQTLRIECDVCTTTKLYNIVIPWDICDLVVIEDIRVQKDSIINGCSGVPGCMFAPDAQNNFHVDWPTIQEGSCLEIVVKNISNAQICFRAGAWAAVFVY